VESVAIAGVGLIGGSFALAIRRAGFRGEIAGISSEATIRAARGAGLIDRGITFTEARNFGLVLLAQPIRVILDSLPQLTGSAAWVTDAGSTKRAICAAAAAAGVERFTGGHPMAGKEVRGWAHADPDLFRGRPWIFTSEPPPPLTALVESTGARIAVVRPEEHDRAVALTSHLPQLLSSALAASAKGRPEQLFAAGPGWQSMTRLAASGWDLWRDILATNADFIQAEWERLRESLDGAASGLPDRVSGAAELFRAAASLAGPDATPVPERKRENPALSTESHHKNN
jgi:prephenate dehydrogenase